MRNPGGLTGFCLFMILHPFLLSPGFGQDQSAAQAPDQKAWSIHFQSTSIGQYHDTFFSLYEGSNSLPSHPETRMSFTATGFLGLRISESINLVVDPEVSAGRGFGQVTGIAGFPNGEITRVTSVAPKIYIARAYIRKVWAIGKETETVDDAANQIAGKQPVRRLTWIWGKFAITDRFDNNAFGNDPRTQFFNWALMFNGAWDYPADVRGYTAGTMLELTMKQWSLRAAVVAEPTTANGPTLDMRLTKNRGTAAEWEWRNKRAGRAGALRVLAFLNREDAGAFRQAFLANGSVDLAATRRDGTKKYGFGINFDQDITPNIGAFGRYGWNDGKTESFAFTQIDRSISGGVKIKGSLWKRKEDHIGIAAIRNFLSGDQRGFLEAGGTGFIIGDGRMTYDPESIVETYYSWHAPKGWTISADYQHIQNPAYNRDRGPLWVASIRLHWEY
jgi:high affinity Mn2+ porin